ncbi:unnamed protein product [Agarophyton chilense]|eukprot:gb/GEZJ01002666.1/.p1 GENE.gb/GEZJ01002666.1/~~gb/GEZJ01002666.1/.p1  ORF type:complete len:895 (+),score=110.91 gb/GEZJ01002666.1/:212-2896(+)
MTSKSFEASSRAKSHGEFLRLWESNAPLTQDQLQLCALVESNCSTFSPVSNVSKSAADADLNAKQMDNEKIMFAYQGEDGLEGLDKVSTAEEFHIWHDEMERRLEEANEHKYRSLVDGLKQDRKACLKLIETVDSALEALKKIESGHKYVSDVVLQFKSECETMVSERKTLGELADALRKRLTYFEELETLTAKFGGGKNSIKPTDTDFVKLLHRLDECVAYASSSTGAVAEADGYLARFLELQRRAFTSIRDHTVRVFRDTAAQVAKELRQDRLSGAGFRHADLTDASKEYLRFRTIAPRIKSLMTELYSRAKAVPSSPRTSSSMGHHELNLSPYPRRPSSTTDAYSNPASSGMAGFNVNSMFSTRNTALGLYADCEESFFEERKRLLDSSVTAHVKSLADVKNMVALARLGSAYVLRVCQLERQLYEHFFPPNGEEENGTSILHSALHSVCDVVYTELRPLILQEDDLDNLVYLIEVLKTEILGDEVPRRGFAGKAFAPSVVRAIADAQERIIYRAEVYMRDEIRGFVPSPHHLNYPEIILEFNKRASSSGHFIATSVQKSIDAGEAPEPTLGEKDTFVPDIRSVGIYATWYPPVEKTLRLLSMLYRCVDGEVFAGVAQEAVAICVQSVGSAAARITAQDKPNAEDHAQLFLIWQLLMTREQISPFDVDMSYTEHELDFFELRTLLGSVIRGELSARSLAAPPAVREKVFDSKRELDHRVRGACESFILKTTRLILDPVLLFLAKCNALPASRTAHRVLEDGDLPPTPPSTPFESQKSNVGSFAHPTQVRKIWEKVDKAVNEELAPVVERMKIYITKPASRAVLLRPIRANVAEAATELLSLLQQRYTLEEREDIAVDGAKVGKLLEDVDSVTELGMKTPRSARSGTIDMVR